MFILKSHVTLDSSLVQRPIAGATPIGELLVTHGNRRIHGHGVVGHSTTCHILETHLGVDNFTIDILSNIRRVRSDTGLVSTSLACKDSKENG